VSRDFSLDSGPALATLQVESQHPFDPLIQFIKLLQDAFLPSIQLLKQI
jgi:hypothetical protein